MPTPFWFGRARTRAGIYSEHATAAERGDPAPEPPKWLPSKAIARATQYINSNKLLEKC
jgi:hypothetical protein